VDEVRTVPDDAGVDRRDEAEPADADRGPWLTEAQQRSWRSYLHGSALLAEALNRQLETDSAVSVNEYEILVRLSETDSHTLRMSELASSLVHSRSRLTHTVSRLEARGLVERQTCLADGRGVNCVLTDAGFELLKEAAPGHVRAVRRHLVDVLSAEQLTALGEAMASVAAAAPRRTSRQGSDATGGPAA
jgi:DNA-binding MarR family transcriptional regulator